MRILPAILFATLCGTAHAQIQLPSAQQPTTSALTDPDYSAGAQELMDADKRFAEDVRQRGGAAFAAWFAQDGVEMPNDKPAVHGRTAISAGATWKPDEYHLTWTPEGARMGPSHDSGVTWGSYEGRSRDKQGNPIVTKGRYVTVWSREKSGAWKVVLDTSNQGPPDAGDCCKVQ